MCSFKEVERQQQPVLSDRTVYIAQMRGKLLPAPPTVRCRMYRTWLALLLPSTSVAHHGDRMVQQLKERSYGAA
jgi:hypothetical protein